MSLRVKFIQVSVMKVRTCLLFIVIGIRVLSCVEQVHVLRPDQALRRGGGEGERGAPDCGFHRHREGVEGEGRHAAVRAAEGHDVRAAVGGLR